MRIGIEEARNLLEGGMKSVGYSEDQSATIADHLLDCELRGLGYAGLARAVTIVEYIHSTNLERGVITTLKESPVSTQLDGANNVGYLVASQATDIALQKAKDMGMAVVGVSKTYYTGMFSYYLERVTEAGFVGMIAGSGPSLVAPFGGSEARFCTNPIAFGFPSQDAPVIWDIGTSSVTHAEVVLAKRLGYPLPDDIAFDAEGNSTTDAAAMLSGGAITAWGGHRGSGLALSIQLLSMMAGQVNAFQPNAGPMDCGFFLAIFDPELFGSTDSFKQAVSDYSAQIAATRPIDPAHRVRVPFSRSHAVRQQQLNEGAIEVPDLVVETLREICATV